MDVILRGAAKAAGLEFYFTGRPCKHGHVCERRVSGGCLECLRVNAARYALTSVYTPRKREVRRAHNLRQFGLTPQQYDAMLASQGGLCGLCMEKQKSRR